MQYSPKLKRVAEQIKKLLKDADIAGLVVLHTPGHAEYVLEITPSYSACKWTPTRDGVIIQGKAEHYGGDKKKRDRKVTDTCNMLSFLAEVGGKQVLNVMQLSELADKTWDAEHGDSSHTSETEQNN